MADSASTTTSSPAKHKLTSPSRPPPPPHSPTTVSKTSTWILWRDALFLLFLGSALKIAFFVETHPGAAGSEFIHSYFMPNEPSSTENIVDSGFVITTPLYTFLEKNNAINDQLALFNSIGLFLPLLYAIKVTFWDADYTLGFRIIVTQLFRSCELSLPPTLCS
jgi:hypothetical protein